MIGRYPERVKKTVDDHRSLRCLSDKNQFRILSRRIVSRIKTDVIKEIYLYQAMTFLGVVTAKKCWKAVFSLLVFNCILSKTNKNTTCH